jgi:hypothetical protein
MESPVRERAVRDEVPLPVLDGANNFALDHRGN